MSQQKEGINASKQGRNEAAKPKEEHSSMGETSHYPNP